MVEIKDAIKEQATDIARLIIMATTDDCCLHFCDEGYGLEDFSKMMTLLVEREKHSLFLRKPILFAWSIFLF